MELYWKVTEICSLNSEIVQTTVRNYFRILLKVFNSQLGFQIRSFHHPIFTEHQQQKANKPDYTIVGNKFSFSGMEKAGPNVNATKTKQK